MFKVRFLIGLAVIGLISGCHSGKNHQAVSNESNDLLPEIDRKSKAACVTSLASPEFDATGFSNECLVSQGGTLSREDTFKLTSSRLFIFSYVSPEGLKKGEVKLGVLDFKKDGTYELRFTWLGGSLALVSSEDNATKTPIAYIEVNNGSYKLLDSGEIEMSYPSSSSCSWKIRKSGSIKLSPHLFRREDHGVIAGFSMSEEESPLFGERGTSVFSASPYGKTDFPQIDKDFKRATPMDIKGTVYAALYGCFINHMTDFMEEKH